MRLPKGGMVGIFKENSDTRGYARDLKILCQLFLKYILILGDKYAGR
jgi:hypothetical protein